MPAKKLLAVIAAAGIAAAGCNVEVPRDQPCPSGYHRLSTWYDHNRTSAWCAPDGSN